MAETLGDTMGNVEAEILFHAFADTQLEIGLETLKHTVADVMTEALIDSQLR